MSACALQATAGGDLTAEKVKELEETRTKFGLSQASAQKIIKGAQNQHLISNMNVRSTPCQGRFR